MASVTPLSSNGMSPRSSGVDARTTLEAPTRRWRAHHWAVRYLPVACTTTSTPKASQSTSPGSLAWISGIWRPSMTSDSPSSLTGRGNGP